MNLTSTVIALLLFIINGQIMFDIALFYGLSTMIGGYVGAKVAIKKGSILIRLIFLVMAFLVGIKLIYETIL